MSEVFEEWNSIETQFIGLRCKLRYLRGKIAVFTQNEHPNELNRNTTAVDQTAKMLSKEINIALQILDQYELYKDYYNIQEAGYEKILEIFNKNSILTFDENSL